MNDSTPALALLMEDDPADAELIKAAMTELKPTPPGVIWVTSLAAGLDWLCSEEADVVLLGLSLPEGSEPEVFDKIWAAAPGVPVLMLSEAGRETINLWQGSGGPYHNISKSRIDGDLLSRVLGSLMANKSAQDAALQNEARFGAICDGSPLGIFVSDAKGECTYTNKAYQRISGRSLEDTLGRRWHESIHHDDRERASSGWYEAVRNGTVFDAEYRFLQRTGAVVWVRVNAAPMKVHRKLIGYVKTVEDVSDRKALDDALFLEKERAEVTLRSIGDGVVTTDTAGNVAYINPVAEQLTGWLLHEARGRRLCEVLNFEDATTGEPGRNPLELAVRENQSVELALNSVLIRRDGSALAIEDSASPIHDREGNITGGVMVFHDASESRAAARKITHLAEHDVLTDLPNRGLLNDRLTQAMALARRHNKKVALLFLDLDHFKHVNDSLGHAVGDKLLQSVAACLTACVRTSDTVCRQGGDEFLVLLSEIREIEDARRFAEKISAMLAAPHLISGNELEVTASIGISIYPDDGETVEAILHCADIAMYHAKEHGRNNASLFTDEMKARVINRVTVESRLYRAIARQEFVLHYQPKMDLSTGAMVGTEALIRWEDPEHGLIFPDAFISIAEQCGLIVPIGQWVLRAACKQAKTWVDAGLRGALPLAINISSVQFRHPEFLKCFCHILKDTGVDAACLELELTESVLMLDSEATVTMLRTIKDMGVKLAIDDFGTGYSSLSYFRRLPIDTLKMDKSFVHGITNDQNDATIVAAVISMGRSLNKRVIAEGVETATQLSFLRAHHCHEGQGFYFSRPVPARDFNASYGST